MFERAYLPVISGTGLNGLSGELTEDEPLRNLLNGSPRALNTLSLNIKLSLTKIVGLSPRMISNSCVVARKQSGLSPSLTTVAFSKKVAHVSLPTNSTSLLKETRISAAVSLNLAEVTVGARSNTVRFAEPTRLSPPSIERDKENWVDMPTEAIYKIKRDGLMTIAKQELLELFSFLKCQHFPILSLHFIEIC